MVDTDGQASAGIEVTPEMIDAGVNAFYESDVEYDPPKEIVRFILVSALRESRQSSP